jgi:hypothetical protein
VFDASSRATGGRHHRSGSGGANNGASETRGCSFAFRGGFAICRRRGVARGCRFAEQRAGRRGVAERRDLIRRCTDSTRCRRGPTHWNADQSGRDG